MKKNVSNILLIASCFCTSFLFLSAKGNNVSQNIDKKRAFIEIAPSGAILAMVTMQSTLSQDMRMSIVPSFSNRFLRAFRNEMEFGERWILEGWVDDNYERKILYDSHETFQAHENRQMELQKKAKLLSREQKFEMLQSDDPEERKYAHELISALFGVRGGSRRSIERASDITRLEYGVLLHQLPGSITDMQKKHGETLRYIQLSIKPIGTNTMNVLHSNIIDLQDSHEIEEFNRLRERGLVPESCG